MYDEVGMIQDAFTFRLINNGTTAANYKIKLVKIGTGNLSTSDVKYGLTKDGETKIALLSSLTNGVIDSGTIDGNQTTIEYELRLWIKDAVTDNSAISEKSLSYRVDVEVSQEIETLKVMLANQEFDVFGQVDNFPDFSRVSSETNGRGIYIYQEDGTDIYYWRGQVTNNHVIFAGYCWEMVRTTKNGGIKMIYDGEVVEVDRVQTCPNTGKLSQLASESAFNPNSKDNAYVGYMYGLIGVTEADATTERCIKLNSTGDAAEVGSETNKDDCIEAGGKWTTSGYEATHANVVNSTIKNKIDAWFSTSDLNTEENLGKLEDTVYCNDRSILRGEGYGRTQTYYFTTEEKPSLECTNLNDRFTVSSANGNGELTYPVGLLTADEMVLAGGVFSNNENDKKNNADYYLYTGQNYRSLSPYCHYYNGGAQLIYVQHQGALRNYVPNNVIYSGGVRPVVTLASGIQLNGLGTEESPFVVE